MDCDHDVGQLNLNWRLPSQLLTFQSHAEGIRGGSRATRK